MGATKSVTKEIIKGKDIIIYGAGACGEIADLGLKEWGGFRSILFCDKKKNGEEIDGSNTIFPEMLSEYPDAIVILASVNYFYEMLQECQRQRIQNIYNMEEIFLSDLPYEKLSYRAKEVYFNGYKYQDVIAHQPDKNYISIGKVELAVTEACTLNCRDCCNLMPYYSHPKHMDVGVTINSVNMLLTVVDHISEMRILGGEPFLNPDIWQIIDCFYGDERIGMISVYTNGTIVPNEKTLESLQHKKVVVHISDYRIRQKEIDVLISTLKEIGIRFFLRRYDRWNNLGEMSRKNYTKSQVEEIFQKCIARNCYTIKGDRLYRCPRSAHGTAAGLLPEFTNGNEYLSLERAPDRDALTDYLYSAKPIHACAYCTGTPDEYVDAGVQQPRVSAYRSK